MKNSVKIKKKETYWREVVVGINLAKLFSGEPLWRAFLDRGF